MENPFLMSDSNLLKLLSSYKKWLDSGENTLVDGPNWISRQQRIIDKLWDIEKIKSLSNEDYYKLMREYLNSLGGAFPGHGERHISNTRDQIINNLEYLKNYQGEPFSLAEEFLLGDKKIRLYARSFWTPLFQRKFPHKLPSWNGKTDVCLSSLGVYYDPQANDIEKYKVVANAFSYLNSLDSTLDFPKLDHFMHYCVAVEEGKNLVMKLTEISPILSKFIKQAQTADQQTRSYPKNFKDFFLSVSFGQGGQARIPWIGFDVYEKNETKGIFINYLYFKDLNKIALVFGVKEENKPDYSWPESISKNYQTVGEVIPTAPRYKSSYVYKIYNVNNNQIQEDKEIIERDLDEILEIYKAALPKPVTYWILAAGTGGDKWEEFRDNNIIAISLGDYNLGDLSNYNTKEELETRIRGDATESKKNDILCAWEFSHVMKPGDIVIIKKGNDTLLGYGEVKSDYIYIADKENYKHTREIEWKKLNEVKTTGHDGPLVLKTLTNLSQYSGYPERLVKAIDEEEILQGSDNYWWMYCNPKVWDPAIAPVGFEQTYTAINERGNKRRIFRNFKDAKKGDLILGYVSTPIKQITSIFEVTKTLEESDGKEIGFKIIEHLKDPIDLEDLQSIPELKSSEPFVNSQGSFYKLTKDQYDIILGLSESAPQNDIQEWKREDTMRDLFIEEEELDSILESLRYKKNIILQGPPGVGKTFYAKRIAYDLFKAKDPNRIAVIQFHQSYSYEDFIQGYRPTEDGNFVLRKGLFYEFCIKAQRDKENDYVFIIDEINRGNLSKIFGELMMLIESDKRGPEYGIKLPYQKESDLSFYIPENLYLIGTMNTADRSLAMVDYALRRRFRFITLNPVFNDKFSEYLKNMGVSSNVIHKIISNIAELNDEISKESNLGKGFAIGHSYFTPTMQIENSEEWYKTIIDNEIAPLIQEYFFDDEDKANSLIEKLYK